MSFFVVSLIRRRWLSFQSPPILALSTIIANSGVLGDGWNDSLTLRLRTLPRPHHAVEIKIPDRLVEVVDPTTVSGWDAKDSPEARAFGDRWLAERCSAVLVVPALPCRPLGRNVLINPERPDADQI